MAGVGKLCYSTGSGGTLHLDGSIDNITNLEGAEGAAGVSCSGSFEAAVFREVAKDLSCKKGLALTKAKEVV